MTGSDALPVLAQIRSYSYRIDWMDIRQIRLKRLHMKGDTATPMFYK